MQVLSIIVTTAVATFLFFLWYNGFSGRPLMIFGWQIHHSVTAVFSVLLGLFMGNSTILSIGLGMYISHVVEEIYFNGESFGKALSIFITRA
ncbi:MAG: hypothetical protein HYY10_02010 [Candidatus Liptonbacteria bacterium]|nr:hypothetical protein [Candidatus Liptonbacteria bacterium]